MDTESITSWIVSTDDILATPPSARISAGILSRAITATAPDFSAITACSALTTSIITPPFSISAKPFFILKVDSIFIYLILPTNCYRHKSNHLILLVNCNYYLYGRIVYSIFCVNLNYLIYLIRSVMIGDYYF